MNTAALLRDRQPRIKDFAGFLSEVIAAESGAPHADLRFFAAPTGLGESVPSRGGFVVPMDLEDSIWHRVIGTGSILSRLTEYTMAFDTLRLPAVDESSRADGSRYGGISLTHINEGKALPASQPKFRMLEFTAKKLVGLTYITDEMLRDMAAFSTWWNSAVAIEASGVLENEVVSGTGSGQGLGILNSNATIEIAKESGQAGATIVSANVTTMWLRLWGPGRSNSVWLVHPDTESQIQTLSTSSVPLWRPGRTEDDLPTLLGRPLIVTESCSAVGTAGDIILADLSQFALARRSERFDMSADLRFLFNESALRLRLRFDLMPMWNSALTQRNSSTTVSMAVTLADRA